VQQHFAQVAAIPTGEEVPGRPRQRQEARPRPAEDRLLAVFDEDALLSPIQFFTRRLGFQVMVLSDG
jgi:hypothetical protein